MKSQLLQRNDLPRQTVDSMFLLLSRYFKNIRRDAFENDLSEKNWVILLRHPETGVLQGFSTLLLYEAAIHDEPCRVVCSGDTIVEPAAWRSTSLSSAWIGAVNSLRRSLSENTLHWLLLVSGYRTYRFLPVFWRQFYPRYNESTPLCVQQIIHTLAGDRFGSQYDPSSGVVRFKHPQVLDTALSRIPEHRRTNPHVDFFLRANPGYANGDELVCYTELKESNLTSAGKRMWRAGDKLHEEMELRG